jgi:hemerythrin
MAYLNWSEKFSVNVRELDGQHMTLVDKINVLHQSLLDNKGREAQNRIIEELLVYAEVHFTAEEKQMRKLNHPGYQKHKLEHDAFTAKALELQQRFSVRILLTLEVLSFLKNGCRIISWYRQGIFAAF